MVVTQTEARTDLRGLAQDITWLDAVLSDAVALQRARAGETLPGVYISEYLPRMDELKDAKTLTEGTSDTQLTEEEHIAIEKAGRIWREQINKHKQK